MNSQPFSVFSKIFQLKER